MTAHPPGTASVHPKTSWNSASQVCSMRRRVEGIPDAGSPPQITLAIELEDGCSPGIAHRIREMERVRGRRDQQIGLVELDHLHATLGLHAAGNHRDMHQVERVMRRPEKHVRVVIGAGQRGIAGADAHRIERAGAGARPDFAIERGIAKRARRGGRARGREDHPSLLRPRLVIDGRIATPWRIFRHIVGHLVFGGDGKLREVGDRSDVLGAQLRGAEFLAIEGAVVVEVGKHRAQLLFLDLADARARGRLELRRPVLLRSGLFLAAHVFDQHREPSFAGVEASRSDALSVSFFHRARLSHDP